MDKFSVLHGVENYFSEVDWNGIFASLACNERSERSPPRSPKCLKAWNAYDVLIPVTAASGYQLPAVICVSFLSQFFRNFRCSLKMEPPRDDSLQDLSLQRPSSCGRYLFCI